MIYTLTYVVPIKFHHRFLKGWWPSKIIFYLLKLNIYFDYTYVSSAVSPVWLYKAMNNTNLSSLKFIWRDYYIWINITCRRKPEAMANRISYESYSFCSTRNGTWDFKTELQPQHFSLFVLKQILPKSLSSPSWTGTCESPDLASQNARMLHHDLLRLILVKLQK